jgi:signal transduction histidine kinase
VIEAADTERRRVGRDLHDGAQQRLLAVSNLLRVARAKAGEDAEPLIALAEAELAAAHGELRELARGLHPVALAERGLPAAIESLCAASSVPVGLEVCPDPLPDDVATAAYFVIAECLTNAGRYGRASEVRVRVRVTPEGHARHRGRRRRRRRRGSHGGHGPARPRRPRRGHGRQA